MKMCDSCLSRLHNEINGCNGGMQKLVAYHCQNKINTKSCFKQFIEYLISNQPERSKREDTDCKDCGCVCHNGCKWCKHNCGGQ